MKYVNGDFDKMGNIWDDIVGVVTGEKNVTSLVGDLVYKEAMKLVEKEANLVKSFASKAVSAANAVATQASIINTATNQTTADAILKEARSKQATAKNEAANAAKNYALTQAAMKGLLSIKGLPQSVIDGANAILKGAKASLDSATAASSRATQALNTVESAHAAKYGTFLSNLTNFNALYSSPYGKYILIGGGVLAVSLLGLVAYKVIKNKKGA